MKNILLIAALMLVLFAMVVYSAYGADAPHNASLSIGCTDCHPQQPGAPYSDSLCLSCHNNATGSGYTKNTAPRMATHSSANTSDTYGSWTVDCIVCHNKHVQDQVAASGPSAYLITGTITSVSDNGDGTTTFGYMNQVENIAGWGEDRTRWSRKSSGNASAGNERGLILFADTADPAVSFEILSASDAFMTVKGSLNAAFPDKALLGKTFALVYGQNINAGIVTNASTTRSVNFYQNSSMKSFAYNDSSTPGSPDPAADGVCQVCHTRTSFWREDGSAADHYSGENCTRCHKHEAGFKTSCDVCHDAPPTVGKHALHAGSSDPRYGTAKIGSTPSAYGFSCGTCHQGTHLNSASDPRTVEVVFGGVAAQGGAASYSASVSSVDDPGKGYTFNYSDGTCSNTYCHGNYPGSGIKTAVTFTTGAAPCGSCHGASNATVPASGSHSQHSSSSRYNFSCALCHNSEIAGSGGSYTISDKQKHVNGTVDWSFDPSDPRLSALSQYSVAPGTAAPSDGASRAYGNCANVYCHSNVQPDGGAGPPSRYAAPKWGDKSASACGSCHDGGHGAPVQIATGSHAKHLEYTFLTKTDRYRCTVCHKMNPAGTLNSCTGCHANGLLPPFSIHPDHKVDVAFDPLFGGTYNGTPAPGDGYSNCKDTYCHSDGTFVATSKIRTNTTPFWGSGSLACNACHGIPPDYPQGSPKKNSHLQHSGETCNACHVATTADGTTISSKAQHVNRLYDVNPDTGKGISFVYTFSRSGGTCTNISCHGGGTAQWGSALGCQGCHSATADVDDYEGEFYNNGIASKIRDAGEWNVTGHGRPSASGNYASGNAPGAFTGTDACLYCHDDSVLHKTGANPFRLRSIADALWGMNGVCQNCHAAGSAGVTAGATRKNGTAKVGSTHYGSKHTTGANGGRFCWDCHDPHGDGNIFMVHAAVSKTTNTFTGAPVSTVTTSFVSFATGTGYAASTPPFTGVCNVCHTDTMHYTSQSGDGHNSETRCTLCHKHTGKTSTDAFTGDCIGCHSYPQGKRAAVVGQLSANSHHVQGPEVTEQHCYQCHWEANSDGSVNGAYHAGSGHPDAAVNLVIYGAGTRPVSYQVGTTAVEYTANGSRTEIQKISIHCLGCHNEQNKTAVPFGDDKTPNHYAWDGTCSNPVYNGNKSACVSNSGTWTPGSSVAARYSETGTTAWGKYNSLTNAGKKNFTKAYSAHGNAGLNQRGWNATTGVDAIVDGSAANTSGNINVQCFDCHNSHGSGAQGTTTRYASATTNGGILKDTTAGLGGYSVTYRPESGGSDSDKNIRNAGASLCLDCHLTESGAESKPWGYNSIFGAIQAITGYWDTPYLAPGTAGAQLRFPYKNQNRNAGGHFGKSSEMSTMPSDTISGLCTSCHDPHGLSPSLGQNRQYAVPLLKGTWLTSPYKEDVSPAGNQVRSGLYGVPYNIDQNTFGPGIRSIVTGMTETDGAFAGLCLQCHSKSSLTDGINGGAWKSVDRIHESVKGWGANVKHNYSCSKCHAPHNGSVLPRLMITDCLDSSHKGRAAKNPSPALSGSGSGSGSYGSGSGSGKFPGSYNSSGSGGSFQQGPNPGNGLVACHENQTGSATDQRWNQVTPWSSSALAPPTVVDQPNFGCSASCTTNLQWSTAIAADGDAVAYYVQIDDAVDFSSPNYVLTWNAGTTWSVVLPSSKTWYWRVQARDTVHTSVVSDWSRADVFTMTVPVAPPAPVLIDEPNTGCSGASCVITLQWNAVTAPDGDPVRYNLQVDDAADFSSVNYSGSALSTVAVNFTLQTGKTWYWRVQALESGYGHTTYSSWSTDSFDMIVPPPAPVLIDEPNSACTTSCVVTLQTNTVAAPDGHPVEYMFQLDDASDFSSPNAVSSWLTGTSWTVALEGGKDWYWRVQARDAAAGHTAAVSPWSASDRFVLSTGAPPAQVTLVSPANGMTDYSCDNYYYMTFTWNPVPLAEYQVQVTTDSTFTAITYNPGWIMNTSWGGGLSTTATYYWRVQARDAVSQVTGPWSSTRSFTITDTGPCSTTCPMVYTWNGTKFAFESDVYTKGKLGLKYSTGFLKPNPNDYYLLLNDPLKTNGSYELKIVEERSETDYLDSLKLFTLDVPENREVYTEILFSTTKYVDPGILLHTVDKNLKAPLSIMHVNTGEDVSSLLSASDKNFLVLSNDRNLDFNWHTVELNLGDLSAAPQVKLIIDAVSAFPTTPDGLMRASSLDYNGQRTKIEVLDAAGNWVIVPASTKELPIPKGFRRPYIVDISNIFQTKTNVYKVRLSFLYKTYIDSISFDVTADQPMSVNEVPLLSASLDYYGFSATVGTAEIYEHVYGDKIGKEASYMPGSYTRYGNVKPLLTQTDDMFVIFGSGDQITLKFNSEAARPSGTKRRFLLYFNGYYKAHNNVSIPNTVEPLPFAAMSNYPYDPAVETYPADAEHEQYRAEYNTRVQ